MKKIILFSLLILLPNFISAQSKKFIGVNPLGLFWGVLNIQYEFHYDKDNSIAIRGNFVGYSIGSFSNNALGAGASYRWYHDKKPIIGLFYGPSVDLLIWTAEEKNKTLPETHQSLFLGLGGEVGYKWNFNQFGVELYGGLRYYLGHISNLNFGGASLIAGVNLGYIW